MPDRRASTRSRVKHSRGRGEGLLVGVGDVRELRQISARISAEPTKANQNGPVTPQIRAITPAERRPRTMPPKTPIV